MLLRNSIAHLRQQAQAAREVSLAQDVPNHLRWQDTGEALIEALKLEAELIVINAKLVEKGGVEVADGDGVVGDVVGEVVGFTVGNAAFDATAGQHA